MEKTSKDNFKLFFATSCFAFACGFLIFGLFGMIAHEESHAIVALAFGFPINYFSLTHVVFSYSASASNFSVLAVLLAGGCGQVLFALLFFWAFTKFEKDVVLKTMDFTSKTYSVKLGLIFGSEIALLTIAFHGIINAVWECFLNENYQMHHGDVTITALLILLCIVISLIFIGKRFKILNSKVVLVKNSVQDNETTNAFCRHFHYCFSCCFSFFWIFVFSGGMSCLAVL
jgi:hypothetical protein